MTNDQIPSVAELRAKQMEYALSGLPGTASAMESLEFLIETWPRWVGQVDLGPPLVQWNWGSNIDTLRNGGREFAGWLKGRAESDEQRRIRIPSSQVGD